MTFDQAFKILLGHEGGYVNNPDDPGGETNWGISKRQYPGEDIASLTLDEAKAIYRRDYWDKVRADELPGQVRFTVFDMAVNAGVRSAVTELQISCGAEPDGVLGPQTIAKAAECDPLRLAVKINARRLESMTYLKIWPTFGKGWARRVAANLHEVAQ